MNVNHLIIVALVLTIALAIIYVANYKNTLYEKCMATGRADVECYGVIYAGRSLR